MWMKDGLCPGGCIFTFESKAAVPYGKHANNIICKEAFIFINHLISSVSSLLNRFSFVETICKALSLCQHVHLSIIIRLVNILVCVVTYAPLSLFDSYVLVCASSVTDVACCGCCWKFCMRKKEAELDLVLLVWS